MSMINDLIQGGTSGLFSGIGTLATSIRTAITGKAVLTPNEQSALLKQAADIEAASNQAQVQLSLAQAAIDRQDAQSKSPMQRNWRPAIGWVCVFGLAYQFLMCPLFPWIAQVCLPHAGIPMLPKLDTSTLMPLLMGILGLGAMRTVEKIKGAD